MNGHSHFTEGEAEAHTSLTCRARVQTQEASLQSHALNHCATLSLLYRCGTSWPPEPVTLRAGVRPALLQGPGFLPASGDLKAELEPAGPGWAWDPSAFRQLQAHFLQPG